MTLASKKKIARYQTTFGTSVSLALAEAQMTQADLAAVTGTNVAYANHIITGRKPASQRWVELVADHLNLPPEKRRELLEQANDRRKRNKFTLPPYKAASK